MNVRVLIPAAGAGRRMGAGTNKQYMELADRPILARTVEAFEQHPLIDSIIIIVPPAEIPYCKEEIVARGNFCKVTAVVAGGAERQDSVHCGLLACGADDDDLILIHDGARPLVSREIIDRVIESLQQHGACLTAVPVKDTIKVVQDCSVTVTPDRATLWQAQTPQGFRYDLIRAAHDRASRLGLQGTDDAQLAELAGHKVRVVQGDYRNLKITTPDDLSVAERLLAGGKKGSGMIRIGHGYDVHRLVPERKLILGGVEIPHESGLLGHSDADVLLHAICDAVLGAIGEGDIGRHFPDSDPAYKGIDSRRLLHHVIALAAARGFGVSNIDATVIAEEPKLAPYIEPMVKRIAADCRIDVSRTNVKATTTETLGFVGRKEGIAVHAVVLMRSTEWAWRDFV